MAHIKDTWADGETVHDDDVNQWIDAGPPGLVTTITSSATPSFSSDTTDLLDITALVDDISSVTDTGSPANGQKLLVRIYGAAGHTIAWGSGFISSGVATLLAATTAGKTHHVGFVYDGAASKWVCLASDDTGY